MLYVKNRLEADRNLAPELLQSTFPAPGLGLRVETQADRLLVTWNRSSSIARIAAKGVLVIDDGTTHREVPLDSRQIADGSVLYKPASDDVSFRLELYGNQGSATTESMRVLDGTQPTRAESIAAKPASNALPFIASGPREPEQHESPTKTDANAPLPGRQRTEDSRNSASLPSSSGSARSFALQFPVVARPVLPAQTGLRPADVPPPDTPPQQMLQPIPLPIETPPPTVVAPQTPPPSPKPAASSSGIQKPEQPPPAAAQKAASAALFVPPQAVKQVMPDLKSFGIRVIGGVVEVEVRVRIDTRGRVKEAQVLNKDGKTNRALSAAALAAAKQWNFAPATLKGNKVESDHTIVFEFRGSTAR